MKCIKYRTGTILRDYNDYYLVLGVAIHSETKEKLVIYRGLYGDNLVYEGDGECITGVSYRFDDKGKLNSVYLIFYHFDGLWDYYWKQILNQRYGIAEDSDGSIIYLNNEPKKADIMVIYTPYMKGYNSYGHIIYAPYR